MTGDGHGRPGDTVGLREAPTCLQAWHAGLNAGLLRECKYDAGHRGWHRTDDGRLSWSGKLTDAERETAARLRATLDGPPPC